MLIIQSIVAVLVGAGLGFGVVGFVVKRSLQRKTDEMNAKADLVLQEARLSAKRIVDEAETRAEKTNAKAEAKNESIKQKKIQEAQERFTKLRSEFETEKTQFKLDLKERELSIQKGEENLQKTVNEFAQKEEALGLREQELNAMKESLDKQIKINNKRKEELDQANERRIRELENIARLSEAEAKELLLEAVKAKAENEAMALVKDTLENARQNAGKEAKKIVIQSIQRMCAEYTIENTVSVFNLDSDEIKGQIIGREGRNIRALEAATGAEIVVDDTPEAIVISSFDPIRREVARLALKKLVGEIGRAHV